MEINFFDAIYYFLLPMIVYLLYLSVIKIRNRKREKINYLLIENASEFNILVETIYKNNVKLLGLDTEYYRGDEYNGKLCIIQIAVPVDNQIKVYIIDILQIEKAQMTENLFKILLDSKIEKVIHSCDNDVEWIFDEFNLIVKNIFDTQEVFQYINKTKKKTGLNVLINKYFHLNLDKESKKTFQKSDWKQRPLARDQLDYAAMDAYYLIKLRKLLKSELKLLDKGYKNFISGFQDKIEKRLNNSNKRDRNELKAINYLVSNITKCDLEVLEKIKLIFLKIFKMNENLAQRHNINSDKILNLKTIYKIVIKLPRTRDKLLMLIRNQCSLNFDDNVEFLEGILTIINNHILEDKLDSKDRNKEEEGILLIKNDRHEKKMINREKIIKKFSCKKPIYENCRMYAPDGDLLCYCDAKKMNWYLQRKLAELTSEDPPSFKLLFEPNSRGCSDIGDIPSSFYVRYRKNCCVVCGNEQNYMRFHVVPILYRQFFPEKLKSHKSHDVVLLCFPCHEKANQIYDIQKRQLSIKFGIPLNSLSANQQEFIILQQIVRNAKTLYKNYGLIPEEKQTAFSNEIITFLHKNKNNEKYNHFYMTILDMDFSNLPHKNEDLTKDVLSKIKNYKLKTYGENKNNHGKLVVDQIKDFVIFIKEWRIFFIDAFKPQFLPDAWNVEHEFYRTFGVHSKFNKF